MREMAEIETEGAEFEAPTVYRDRFTNNGPFSFEELMSHYEEVADIVRKEERPRLENRVTKVQPEGEGFGILIEYDHHLPTRYIRHFLAKGYLISATDSGRAFVEPFEGESPSLRKRE